MCKLAFVLLLRAYIRTDSVSCAFVRRGSPTTSTTLYNVLHAHLDASATLFLTTVGSICGQPSRMYRKKCTR